MFRLNLPQYQTKIKSRNNKYVIFDELRKKYIALTPEEWVRQHFVHYIINYKGFPKGLIANEISITLNGTSKRCDTIVYDKKGSPIIIIEYKSPNIEITQKVFEQIYRYNIVLRVKYLIISNGLQHYCCKMNYKDNSFKFLKNIPDFNEFIEENDQIT